MNRSHQFPAESASVAAARRFAREALAGCPDALVESVELMVSELATNCIRHVDSSFRLGLGQDGTELRVEVTDTAGGTPRMQAALPQDESGRGLKIVDLLSERWGVRHESAGKTVWFTVRIPTAEREPPAARPAAVSRRTAAMR